LLRRISEYNSPAPQQHSTDKTELLSLLLLLLLLFALLLESSLRFFCECFFFNAEQVASTN